MDVQNAEKMNVCIRQGITNIATAIWLIFEKYEKGNKPILSYNLKY